ncbi:outer membrane receptor protein involved in Fe transport [Novosphingobium sp. PhB57]|nr:outer membrane receptor protein involved in Fe transport [Novosphingobium sp. PhB57]
MRCVHLVPWVGPLFAGVCLPALAQAQVVPASPVGAEAAMMTSAATSTAVAGAGIAAAVNPSDASVPPDEDKDDDPLEVTGGDIVVVAPRILGQLDVPNQPIATFDEDDIAAYGVDSIGDLIDAISPQTGSGRGRGSGTPVILVNGQRITSFREMRNIPPEAIRKLEVLPEEVALRFGYPANQRVVNLILKDKFSATTVAGEFNNPTRGGYDNYELESGIVKIAGPRRYNFNAKYTDTSMLTEDERNVRQEDGSQPTVAGDPEPARYRSLAAADSEFTVGGNMTQNLGDKGMAGSITANGAFTHEVSTSLSGLDTVTLTSPAGSQEVRTLPDPLTSRVVTDTFEAGLGYNTMVGRWMFNVTGDGSYTDAGTRTDRKRDLTGLQDAAAAGTLDIAGALPVVAGAGVDTARSRTLSLSSLATLSGTPFIMPAGDANLTFKGGYDFSRVQSETHSDTSAASTLTRGDVSGGVNLAIPLTSRGDFLGGIGDLALNVSAGLNHLSDFGTLTDWSAGLTWSPTEKLTFQASYLVDQEAPTLAQLGAPSVLTYNVSVYDFTTNSTALVTVLTGGNQDLRKETQRDIKLSATWELPFMERSNLILEYFHNRSSNVSESFPMLTSAVEAAFPDRVQRDASGNLVYVDRRAVTFDEETSSRIRWGLNLSGNLGKKETGGGQGAFGGPPPPGAARGGDGGARPSGASGSGASGGGHQAGGGGPGPGGGGPPPGGPGGPGGKGGRWNLSVYHTWRFTDRVKIADGVPELDQLNGEALTAGGVPRHAIEAEGGMFKNGYGFRLKAEWDAPTRVDGTGLPGSSDLRFGSTFDVKLRIFADLGKNADLVARVPFLKGTRLSLVADNLLDSRQKVTDQNGEVPIAYQAAYREPQGRVLGIDFRKMF